MKNWIVKSLGRSKGNEVTKKFNINDNIGQILINRGIETEDQLDLYMHPDLTSLRDPFLLKDMDRAVDRIKRAISNNEKICIFGDYDVDGVSSTSILCLYFESIGYQVEFYIPNRLEEGYGLNDEAIRQIGQMGTDLIISVDCGITSVNEVETARKLGIDVIITDHHEPQEKLPQAYAVIDPKREDCRYPFKGICGCGVAFKLIHALSGDRDFYNNINRYLEIVALATICDVMPVLDENRIIVKNGLEIMGRGNNIGMRELLSVCSILDTKMKSSHLGFAIGPRINASGRLGFSRLGVELFTSKDPQKARLLAESMNLKNEERQMVEAKILMEAEAMIDRDSKYQKEKVIVLAGHGWHHGIIGIVASKLTEKYYKPTVLLCIEDGVATGSARSIKGFDLFKAMSECKDLMMKFGGHEQAAGLTMAEENIQDLRERINAIADYELEKEDLIENINIEFELEEESIGLDLVNDLHILEPFGIKNPTPYFMVRDYKVKKAYLIGKDKNHLKLSIEKEYTYDCIGFNMGHLMDKFSVDDRVDIVFQLDENTFKGRTTVQMLIKDIRLSKPDKIYKYNNILKVQSKIVDFDGLSSINGYKQENKTSCDTIGRFRDMFKRDTSRDIEISNKIDDDTLVIVNTIEGYFRAMSDINISNSEKIKPIFLSNIDKTYSKVYNKIVIYDYFDNIKEVDKLEGILLADTELIFNMDELDFIYQANKIKDLEFSRDCFVDIYKRLASQVELNVRLSSFVAATGISFTKLVSILRVLESEQLISYEIDYDEGIFKNIMLPKPKNKLNLEDNSLVRGLESLINNFKTSYGM